MKIQNVNKKITRPLFAFALFGVLIVGLLGCEEDRRTTAEDSIDEVDRIAIFDPSAGVIPFPNNLLFTGTTDGTLNIPVVDPEDISDPKVAMNGLDGFSTSAFISTTFSSPIDASTLPGNVRIFSVGIDDFNINPTGPTFAVTAVNSELANGVDFIATVSGLTSLIIVPIKPLAPKSGYMVVLTNGLLDTSGISYTADITYALTKQTTSLISGSTSLIGALEDEQAQALEPLRLFTNAAETAVSTYAAGTLASLDRADIILSWSFSTQSTTDVLGIVRAAVPVTPTLGTFTSVNPQSSFGLPTTVDIYKGTIDVPYYLSAGKTPETYTDVLNKFWKGSDDNHLSLSNGKTPSATETLTIPLLVTVPAPTVAIPRNSSSIPVIIYQHGITSDRSTVIALAEKMASIGYAMVAIDLPLHGLVPPDPNSPLALIYDANNERTFGLDLVNNTDPSLGPDSIVDASGTHFINLASLQTSRDNVRQGVSDLFVLTQSLITMDLEGNNSGADFDSSRISFIGHSLGAIVGVPFLALETNIQEGVIAMGGGSIAKILDGSAAFGPQVSGGLALKGVIKGTSEYESFLLAAQTVLDAADPINFGAAAAANHNILALEIVGNGSTGGTSPSDLVIPNTVPDGNDTTSTAQAPLAGTEPLIGAAVMALTQIDTTASNMAGLDVVIKYSAGEHSSLLTGNSANSNVIFSAEVFAEIKNNISTFIGSDGQDVTITDANVILPVPVP